MPLELIDERLKQFKIGEADLAEITYKQWRTILGVDAVVMGDVTRASNFTGGIHAETTIDAKLSLLDLRTGNILWDIEHSEMAYSGIAIPSVVTMIQGQIDNADVKRSFYRTAEKFSIRVLNELPDPSEFRMTRVALPMITRIETNLKVGEIVEPGDKVLVNMHGQPGLSASFDIGSWRSDIAMQEIASGVYRGEYLFQPGDRVNNAMVIGTLKNPNGVSGKKYFRNALVSTPAGL